MRGEDSPESPETTHSPGSPPHARGRPRGVLRRIVGERITPACAGKTPRKHPAATPRWDHPRMRGEDRGVFDEVGFDLGSPPHARGRRDSTSVEVQRHGITPACAGKTGYRSPGTGLWEDHPRMRGEDTSTASSPLTHGGSPPHARGRLRTKHKQRHRSGITPACAGKTKARVGRHLGVQDHPRMRGEDICCA